MNAAGQLAVREDAALNALKAKLGISASPSSAAPGGGGGGGSATNVIPPHLQPVVDVFLLRFMRNKKLNIEETMEKLRRRREFEASLPAISITPTCVKALRSGAFHLIGVDVMRRPVLYVRLHVFRTVTDVEEMEKLAIVLLEYMQSVAMHCSQQEVVLLLGQHDATWYHAQGIGSVQSELLIALLSKYFPDLVGLVLMVDAPWATRQRVKTALASAAASSRARNLLQIVSKTDLQRFVDVTILPEDLGGRHALGSPNDFSESVLRHWYATVCFVQQESTGGGPGRPLCIPTSAIVGSSNSSGATPSNSLRTGSSHRGPASLQKSTSGLTPRRSRLAQPTVDSTTDDGMCSVISDTDVEMLDEDEDTDTDVLSAGAAAAGAAGHGPADGQGGAGGGKSQLQQELRAERDRRMALEHELTRLRLGITIDPSTATHLEAALKHIHDDLNVVIGEIIARSKSTNPAGSNAPMSSLQQHQQRRSGGDQHGPSLHQLIELTDSQVLRVVQERQHVPAMSFTSPPADRSRGRGACALM